MLCEKCGKPVFTIKKGRLAYDEQGNVYTEHISVRRSCGCGTVEVESEEQEAEEYA